MFLTELDGIRSSSSLERAVLRGGSCREHEHPEWWTQSPRQPGGVAAQNMAKHICRQQCPVLDKCRAWCDEMESNLPNDDHFLVAVYAGEGPKERVTRRANAQPQA